MNIGLNENASQEFDSRQLSSLIVELNIARRNFASYPKDHPLIISSLNKALEIYDLFILTHGETVIGIARNSLIVRGELLDKNNIIFSKFAKILFEHGIGALTLRHGLTTDELRSFNEILCLKREELLNRGGIAIQWKEAAIISMEMQPIRYDMFNVVDASTLPEQEIQSTAHSLWERFARSLLQNIIAAGGAITGGDGCGPLVNANDASGLGGGSYSSGDIIVSDDEIDPRLLASILNRQMGEPDNREGNGIPVTEIGALGEGAMTTFRILSQSVGDAQIDLVVPYEKLADFISALNPELRRRFLSSSFNINTISGGTMAEEIIPRLSLEVIAETLEDVRQNRFIAQPSIMGLLKKLGANAQHQQSSSRIKQDELMEMQRKVRNIFREHSSEEFVPEEYQKNLERIVTEEHDYDIDHNEIAELMETLDGHFVENQISDIIVRIMLFDSDPEKIAQLVNNLSEIFYYLLSTGDYFQLVHLIDQCQSTEISPEVRHRLQQSYSSNDSLNEMLVGLTTWGKSKYDDVTRLIRTIGEPFIEVLLDRLAVEDTLSLRRFIMDRILEFGHRARRPMVLRLSDGRWFLLRNLIIMLRQLNDETIVEHVRPLLRHSHPRVRQEALRTCLSFRDPAAERQILYDMDSSDHEVQISAIYIAEKSRSADVFKKLLSFIIKPGFTGVECELKSAVLTTLAEIGRVEALPELWKLLSSRSLLHSRALNKLKIDAIRSMTRYPPAAVLPILKRVAEGSGEIANQAQISLRTLLRKAS